MITFDHVTKRFDDGTVGVDDLTLDVPEGEVVVLVGPSGCGKTTTMRMINRMIQPTGGTLTVDGQDVMTVSPPQLRRRIGYVIQQVGLFPHRTIADNIATVPELVGWDKARTRERVKTLMATVGLPDSVANRYPHQLSGGMRKRTSLAQTLVLDPDIILMDEPFSALDIQTRQLMENEVLELWAAKKKAVLFITHDLDEAIAMSDRVIVLSAGPAAHPMGEFVIDLPRPRDVAEVRVTPRFVDLHKAIWDVMRDEVLKGYAQQKLAA